MSEHDPDPSRPSDDTPVPTDADLVLEPQPVLDTDDAPTPGGPADPTGRDEVSDRSDRTDPLDQAAHDESADAGVPDPTGRQEVADRSARTDTLEQTAHDESSDHAEDASTADQTAHDESSDHAAPADEPERPGNATALAAMWAAVRDQSAEPSHRADPAPVSQAADVDEADAGTRRIPPIPPLVDDEADVPAPTRRPNAAEAEETPVTAAQEAGEPPSSRVVPERQDLPAPEPRDPLERRRQPGASPAQEPRSAPTPVVTPQPPSPPSAEPAAAPDAEPDATATLAAPIRPDPTPSAPTPPAAAAPAPQSAGTEPPTDRAEDLTQTRVRRRSLIAPADQEAQATPAPEAQWRPREETAERVRPQSTPSSLDDSIFEGATVVPRVPRRTGAHIWSVVLSLLLVPVTWFLLEDAGARLTLATDNPMVTGTVNPAAVGELLAGIAALVLVVALARQSSLGAHVTGIVLVLAGLPWVVAPGWTAETMLPAMQSLNAWNAFGSNVAHHLQASGYSGRILALGVALILIGWLSHAVRRAGRSEEATRAQVERVNPQDAYFTARERRRAAREGTGTHVDTSADARPEARH